jgi:hypothetical protein
LPHRTKIKVLLNPILRKIGFSIVSVFDDENFIGYQIRKYPKYCKIIDDTSECATQTDLAGEQGYDGRVEAKTNVSIKQKLGY